LSKLLEFTGISKSFPGVKALDNVSFSAKGGRVTALMGENGAGKSTLLKILSRVTEPTAGRIELYGRIGSLLEVGTGFHPELTGRENIRLSGAILGMTRREIRRKFGEIVDFAEIGPFLDTPVKRYSSGMYMRLAFAVASHMDAEILLVDEVLTVGDVAFQKKCLERIRGLGGQGGTVLFVTHNMGIVSSLCQTALTLAGGRILGHGDARDQVRQYLAHLGERSTVDLATREDRTGNGAVRVAKVTFSDESGRPVENALAGEPLTIRVAYQAPRPPGSLEVHAWLCDDQGARVSILSSRYTGDIFRGPPARGHLECRIPRVGLTPGTYSLDLCLESGMELCDYVLGAASLGVEPGPFFATGRTPPAEHGPMLTENRWTLGSHGDA